MLELLNHLVDESHSLNVAVTRILLTLDPTACGDCERVCGFGTTLSSLIQLFI